MAAVRNRILISGMMAGDPQQGGATWAVLQYILGFRRLGHAVHFIEPVARASLRPAGVPLSETLNASYFQEVVKSFGLTECAGLICSDTSEALGVSHERLRDFCRE